MATAAELTDTMSADPIAYVVQGYHRFRRYAPRMLRVLDIQSATVALWTYNNDRPNMGICGIRPAQKLKMVA